VPDLIYIPNHRDLALIRDTLSQFHELPRIRSLVRALAAGVQSFEDEGFGILTSTTFTAAAGHDLDIWGAWLGESRGNLDDFAYRRILSAKILANRSDGSTGELATIFALLTEPSTVTYIEAPMFFQFTAFRATSLTDDAAARAGRIMREIKPAGVGMKLIEAIEGYYGFVDDPSQGPRAPQDPPPESLDVGILARYI
jgi:hypothetical protein